jgi:GNAT superfamily N-acetyltransferase
LPSVVDDATSQLARYLNNENAIAFVAETDSKSIACLLGEVASSSFPPVNLGKVGHLAVCWVEPKHINLGKVGHLAVCWVEPKHRKSGIATELVNTAENWFREKGVGLVEVSYMAKNQLAELTWER